MASNESKKPFLGLKLKALYLTGGLFIVIAGLFIALGYAFLHRQFEVQREQAAELYRNQINVLLERSVDRLLQLQDTAVYLEGVAASMLRDDADTLQESFNEYWWKFRIDNQLQSASFVSLKSDKALHWGEYVDVAPLVDLLDENQKRAWDITCTETCYLVVASRITVGKNVYAVVLSTLLDPAFASFTRITNSGVIVVSGGAGTGKFEQALPAWQRVMMQGSRPEIDFRRLASISHELSLDALVDGLQYRKIGDEQIEFMWIDTGHSRVGEENALIVVSDVTQELNGIQQIFREILMVSIFGVLITELILLAVLWKPTTQLRRITDALPLFAVNEFDALRKKFLRSDYVALVEDESDILRKSAVNLSYQLETLHSLLSNRAEQLETRGQELETERNFILGLLNTAHAIILTQDDDGEILMINRFGADLIGLKADDLDGQRFAGLLSASEETHRVLDSLRRLAHGEIQECHHESIVLCPDGSKKYISWYHARLPDANHEGHHVLSIGMDVSEKIAAEENLDWLAGHDPLTGLMNRARFEEELDQILAASQRYEHAGALFMINLDQFKDINDSSGHQVGDEMLRMVSGRLLESCQDGDIVARIGGDEFAVLVQEADEISAGEIADRLCRALMQIALTSDTRVHRISASIGVALFPAHGVRKADILTSVGLAMRNAKDMGRNCWSIFNENELGKQRINERVYWNEKVKQVLADNSFDMVYQPISDVRSGQVTHYEALLRICGDDGKLVPPDRFIAAAERSNMMQTVDERVIERVMQHQAELKARGIDTSLSINLSGLSFKSSNLIAHIRKAMNENGIDPGSIIFEITETAAVADITVAIAVVESIRALGFRFALDDFGVGFSSLHYLKRLPVDYVKIDGSFIRNLHQEEDDRVLVKALVEISRVFGQSTVAEFVDSQAVLDILGELGVDYAQGYFISKPRSFADIWDKPAA
ncbi:MAG: EAL domain-containing protein [Gammaproteobacteria bacterium]|nr:MAG: EAL domain-containing protein [Gammaproteobacteria bacterium]